MPSNATRIPRRRLGEKEKRERESKRESERQTDRDKQPEREIQTDRENIDKNVT